MKTTIRVSGLPADFDPTRCEVSGVIRSFHMDGDVMVIDDFEPLYVTLRSPGSSSVSSVEPDSNVTGPKFVELDKH